MLWPALRVLSVGELTNEQRHWLLGTLQLVDAARTDGPAAAASIAHRLWTDDDGTRLVLDLARAGESGWVFSLFFDGQPPADGVVAHHRALLRGIVARLGLALVEVTPAITADEVFVAPPPPVELVESALGVPGELPYGDLDQLWPHLGLRSDAPWEVKEVTLRQFMGRRAWSAAPARLRRQAEAFLCRY